MVMTFLLHFPHLKLYQVLKSTVSQGNPMQGFHYNCYAVMTIHNIQWNECHFT